MFEDKLTKLSSLLKKKKRYMYVCYHDKTAFLYGHMAFRIWTWSLSVLVVRVQGTHLWSFEPWAVDRSPGMMRRLPTGRPARRTVPTPLCLAPRAVFALLIDWCRSKSKWRQSQTESEHAWESLAGFGKADCWGYLHNLSFSGIWAEICILGGSQLMLLFQEPPFENHGVILRMANLFHKGPDSKYFWLGSPYSLCCNYSLLLLPASYIFRLTVLFSCLLHSTLHLIIFSIFSQCT